ncbi:uncharacterized protein IWZ02DRAFT_440802 [Phyllosticta citriasiana]|uniref:uncharacterized protein n=1 Tax=Phyllosticta citriasiana TaxID=595635 RepID=UPI0030FD8178
MAGYLCAAFRDQKIRWHVQDSAVSVVHHDKHDQRGRARGISFCRAAERLLGPEACLLDCVRHDCCGRHHASYHRVKPGPHYGRSCGPRFRRGCFFLDISTVHRSKCHRAYWARTDKKKEVAPSSIRGPLLMCWQLTLSVSQILAAAINRGMESNKTPTAYRVPIGFQLIFPGLVFAFVYFVPESPRWLVRQGKEREAVRSLQAIRRGELGYDPQSDLQALRQDVNEEAELTAQSSWLELITNPVERRKLIYSAGALIAQQINGIQWFYYFGTVFAKEIGLSDPFMMTVIVFVIQVFVVLAAVLTANKIPRRPALLIATIIMAISIFIVGCLGIPGSEVSHTNGKVIISFVILEIVSFNFTWGPLGWTIASEMAAGRNRNKIYAIAVACFWVTVWATVFTLPYLYYSADLGPKTGFVYTGLCFITLAYVYFCVGEVTGRTIEEINGFFANGVPAKEWRNQPFARQADRPTELGDFKAKGASSDVKEV